MTGEPCLFPLPPGAWGQGTSESLECAYSGGQKARSVSQTTGRLALLNEEAFSHWSQTGYFWKG